MKRVPTLIAVSMLAAAACADGNPTEPQPVEAAFMTHCMLAVSDADAAAEIAALRAEIDALEADGVLSAGQARALRNHLDNAQRSLDAGRECPALAQLRAFREQVGNYVDDGVLTPEEGGPLIDAADDLIDGPPIANASFEADGVISTFYVQPPTGWTLEGISDFATDQFGGDVDAATSFESHFVTDGTYGARLFSRTGATTSGTPDPRTFFTGDRVRLYQTVDLTGITTVRFDAELRALGTAAWLPFLEARVLIDGVLAWSASATGTYLDETIDVSTQTGLHTFEFRLETVSDATVEFVSAWFLFDNVELIP